MEVMVAHIHAVDLEAFAVIPSMSDLEIAEPRLTVQGAFFFLLVKRVNILPASVPVLLSHDALVRQVVEIGGEVSLENMILNSHNIAVQETHEVFTADIEYVVARSVMLVHLHAASAEQVRYVVFTEESLCNLEAATTSESPMDVTHSDDRISNHVMVIA